MIMAKQGHGIVQMPSKYGIQETLDRIERLLGEHGLTIFARIDFSGDARRSGLSLRPEQMLIFGNPKAGTPLMQAEPVSGIDLPLKALVWEDAAGETWLAYNSPEYLIERHGLPQFLASNLTAPIAILEAATV